MFAAGAGRLVVVAALATLVLSAATLVVPLSSAGAQAGTGPLPVDVDLVPGARGFWVTYADGRVEPRGDAAALGSLSVAPGERVVALVPAASGYWLATSRGRVAGFGGAPGLGDVSALALNGEVIAAVPTTTGAGYYLLGSDGGIFTFGDAGFHGSVQGILDERFGPGRVMANDWLTAPVVTMATTPAGYWLISADGSVFSFGDAAYHGSVQDVVDEQAGPATAARDWLDSPIVGVVPSAAGAGYLMLASDGGIFNFGRSQFHGSIAGQTASPAVAVDVKPDRSGYVVVTADARAWPLGDVRVSEPVGLGDAAECRVGVGADDETQWGTTAAFRVAVLFVDFDDAAADYGTRAEDDGQLAAVEAYLEAAGYGRLDVQFTPLHQWLRAPGSWRDYSETFDNGELNIEAGTVGSVAVGLAGPQFGFAAGFDSVMVVLPSAFFGGGTAGGISRETADGWEYDSVAAVNTKLSVERRNRHNSPWWSTAAHELAHNLGLDDLYPYDGSRHATPAATGGRRWVTVKAGLMGLQGSALVDADDARHNGTVRLPGRWHANDDLFEEHQNPKEMLAWSRWQLGWLRPDQVRCVTGRLADVTVALRPVAAPGNGVAMVAVPVSDTKAIVAETRRRIGYDEDYTRRSKCCNGEGDRVDTGPELAVEGVFMYEVDAEIHGGDLPIRFAGDSGDGRLDAYPAHTPGTTRTWHLPDGTILTIEVEASEDDAFVVRTTRKAA